LFAHADDEIFALPFIDNSDSKLIIYLTDRPYSEAKSKIILGESKLMFQKYLLPLNCHVIWWGEMRKIKDGELHEFTSETEINSLLKAIKSKLNDLGAKTQIESIFCTAFEGAHQDHDSAAYISRAIGKKLNIQPIEISTYPQKYKNFYSFRVLNPVNPRHEFEFDRKRVAHLAFRMILGYKTQRTTWLGLGPWVIYRYLFKRFRDVTPTEISLQSPCFYEFRGRIEQSEVIKHFKN
jgi:hypothetical protein